MNTDERMKAHPCVVFTDAGLPSRRQRGMVLAAFHDGERWCLEVKRLGFSASLACALNEGVLSDWRGDSELRSADMAVIDAWTDYADDYVKMMVEKTGIKDAED